MKKTYTILVTSDNSSKTKNWTISAFKLRTLVIFSAIFLVFCTALLVDYFGLLLEESENKQLRAKNAILREQFKRVEGKILDLESSLERVGGFSAKLRLLVETENDNRDLQLSMNDPVQVEKPSEQEAEKNIPKILSLDELKRQEQPTRELEVYRHSRRDHSWLAVYMEKLVKDSKWVERSADEVLSSLKSLPTPLSALPTVSPVDSGWLVAEFGYRTDPRTQKPVMHPGITLAAAEGADVKAAASGEVSFVGFDDVLGKVVTIDHGLGLKTRYAYASEISVNVGDQVKKKDAIAKVGTTGRAQGPSVYYEVRMNGIPVDPKKFILVE